MRDTRFRVRGDWIGLSGFQGAARRAERASTAATTRGRTESDGHPGLQKRRRGGAVPSCPIYGDRRKEQRRSSKGGRRGFLACPGITAAWSASLLPCKPAHL